MTNPSPEPLISVIVAVFNGAQTLQQCIDSVAQQTYPHKELIIIDGGSKDGTVDIVQKNQSRLAYWISESDKGVYSAWNKGIAKARGQWICFLGADDFFWNARVLEQMASHLINSPQDIRIVYGQVMLLNSDGNEVYSIGEPWENIRKRFTQVMCIPHTGLMHRRSLFEEGAGFDETFRIGGDYELLLRELKSAEASFVPGLVTVAMRQGGLSSTPANSVEAMLDARRAQKMHGYKFPGRYWLAAMFRVYLRLLLWRTLGEKWARNVLDLGRRAKGLPPYWTKT